jgi:hypothetical protein
VNGGFRYAGHHNAYWKQHPWRWNQRLLIFLVRFVVLFGRLMRQVEDVSLRAEYRRRIWRMFRARRDPALLLPYAIKCVVHYHTQKMFANMHDGNGRIVNSI